MSGEDNMKKPMAVSHKQLREEAAILELRREERNNMITLGAIMTTIVIVGQLLAHVLT